MNIKLLLSLSLLVLLTVGCELGNQQVYYGGDVLLQDDFNNVGEFDQPEDWDFVDDSEASNGPSSWFVSDTWNDYYKMALSQESGIGGGGYLGDPTFYGTVALAGDESWTDYSFEVEFHTTEDDGIGFDFRRTDTAGGKSYYRLMFMNDSLNGGPFVKLLYYSYLQGQTVVLAQNTNETYESGDVWNQVKITVIGANITCDLNNSRIFDITDNRLLKGRIGLFCCYLDAGINFDNVLVTALDEGNAPVGNSIVD